MVACLLNLPAQSDDLETAITRPVDVPSGNGTYLLKIFLASAQPWGRSGFSRDALQAFRTSRQKHRG
ncbi:hypothetical protein SAMN05192579_10590 [Rhodanobacter glycinis]|uniref:Uncharacterized protein n=1 Tax=Rhodanobacter glycinis TaxID=582702 RepID=A0A1I4BFX1_9GAMM|nr:hypothetical protein SAMN05192579_10590 [Rhodanobacter glycinis]